MDIKTQIGLGKLRCVRTHATLTQSGDRLSTQDSAQSYPLYQGSIPVLFKEEETAIVLGAKNHAIESEYSRATLYHRIRSALYKDYNCRAYDAIFAKLLADNGQDKLLLSIGGGPIRRAPQVTNMNIGPYPNVDIICDAHDLCYHDETVDAIHCDAVLEHLHTPIRAVQEMHRVLKKGGKVLSVIPFMQGYHGYPHHYQNYTITGHELLYRAQGFSIIASGSCQGPIVAMTTLNSRFCLEYLPRGLNLIIGRGIQALGLLLRPLDRLLEQHPHRYVLASSTFVLAQK